MKNEKMAELFTVLIFTCVVLSASPVSAGIPYCWFNKYINVCGSAYNSHCAYEN